MSSVQCESVIKSNHCQLVIDVVLNAVFVAVLPSFLKNIFDDRKLCRKSNNNNNNNNNNTSAKTKKSTYRSHREMKGSRQCLPHISHQ